MSQALAIGVGARRVRDRDQAVWFALRACRTNGPVNDAHHHVTTAHFDRRGASISTFVREIIANRCASASGSVAGPRKGLIG